MARFCFLCTLTWVLCLPTYAFSLPGRAIWNHIVRSATATASAPAPEQVRSSTSTTAPYFFSVPSAEIVQPSATSQGMIVTAIAPVYEVCNTPGSNTTSCSTIFETATTETCSTILTYAFSKTTITDCTQNVTFATRAEYALSTTTLPAVQARDESDGTPSSVTVTYAQSTLSYFAAPWQSLAADTPTGITVLICTTGYLGAETCILVEEIWIVHTEYVTITTTSTLSLSTYLPSAVVLLLGPSQSLVASAGHFTLSTLIEHSTMSPNATTSTSRSSSSIDGTVPGVLSSQTSTTTSTRTITTTGATTTITMTLSELSATAGLGTADDLTTTLTSHTTITGTTTVQRDITTF